MSDDPQVTQNPPLRARLALTGRMASGLAHEINNPLQAAIGCPGLAQEHVGGTLPEVTRQLDAWVQELHRVARIVAQLRGLHRLSRPEESCPFSRNAVAAQVPELTRSQREAQHVDPAKRLTSLPDVPMVPGRIADVVTDLVLNALAAMPAGGTLTIATARCASPAGVQLLVSDDGAGISAEVLPKVLDMFYTIKEGSLGLGLFVAQSAVAEHGGRITVESQVGQGSVTAVWLPL